MSNAEQDCACLHVDIMALLFRVDLKLAVNDMQNKATSRQTKLVQTLRTRDDNAKIYGNRSVKELREDAVRVQQTALTPTNNAVSH